MNSLIRDNKRLTVSIFVLILSFAQIDPAHCQVSLFTKSLYKNYTQAVLSGIDFYAFKNSTACSNALFNMVD